MTADMARDVTDGVDESSPLIGRNNNNNNRANPRRPPHRPTLSVASITSIKIPKAHDHTTFIALLCALIFAANSAGGFVEIPLTRLAEDALCHQYYDNLQTDGAGRPIDEEMCKIEPVQTKLAFILALVTALNAIVGFFAAFPWSLVADRVGRKPVMALGLGGISISVFWFMLILALPGVFPVSLLWLGSLTQLIGGGNPVLAASVFSMVTDATTDEERAVVFLRIHVASLCGQLFSPSLAALLMERTGPWPPMWLGAGLLSLCSIAVLFLPETFKSAVERPQPEEEGAEDNSGARHHHARLSQLVKRFKDSVSILNSPSLILLLIASLVTSSYVESTSTFMVQFISRRYQMKLEQGGYVQSFYGVAQAIQSLIILPWLCKFVMRGSSGGSSSLSSSSLTSIFRPADTHHRDFLFLCGSTFFIILGSLVLGLAPSLAMFITGLVIFALGTGCGSLIRTMLSLYVDPEHRSRLFGIVSMVEIIGSIYARPMLAALFSLGMKLGGPWIGFPFYGVTVLFAIIAVLFIFVRVPQKSDDPSSAEGIHAS